MFNIGNIVKIKPTAYTGRHPRNKLFNKKGIVTFIGSISVGVKFHNMKKIVYLFKSDITLILKPSQLVFPFMGG